MKDIKIHENFTDINKAFHDIASAHGSMAVQDYYEYWWKEDVYSYFKHLISNILGTSPIWKSTCC